MPLELTLKSARINLGLTLKEGAKLFGIHHETLANYENDSTNVPRSFFIQIEKRYGIPIEFIYFGKFTDFINEKRSKLNLDIEQMA